MKENVEKFTCGEKRMKREQVTDMTKGPVFRQMAAFALPVLLGMIFQRIYNFADAYIVGRYLGDGALAAVSIAGTAMYMMTSIMQGVTTGVSIVISQFYGGGENRKLRKTFAAGIHVALWITVLITVTGVTTADPLLRLLQTGSELLPDARIYLIVIYGGCGATMLYNFASSVLRALGNSLVPLAFLVVSSVMNVILDIALVSWIPMGVAGAALATVISQLFSGVLCLVYALWILPVLRISRREWKPDLYLVGQILRYGIPTGLQMSIISISDMTLQAVVNTYSTAMVVAYGVALKVEGMGFQLAVEKGVRSACLLNLICYGVFCPAVFALAGLIMRAFTDSPDSIRYGAEYMKIFSLFFVAGGILVVYHNVLRASGDVAVTVLMGVSEVITRIGCAFLLPALFGYRGLWFVSPLTWICAALVGGIRYYSGGWKKKAVLAVQKPENQV